MRAITVAIEGGERRLELSDQAEPVPADGEIVVAVQAISLNNGEVRHALGQAAAGDRPGWDFAGIVEEAAAGSGFSAGDPVVGLRFDGAWAERIAVPARQVGRLPATVGFAEASTLPVAGLTALVTLSKQPLAAGRRLLVTAATGGVGRMAIQLGKATGAHVTAFARDPAPADELRALGADAVVVGVEQAEQAETFDLILEGVGGALLGQALGWLKPRGMVVQFGDAAGDEPTTFDARWFRLRDGGMYGGTSLYGFFLLEEMTRPVDPVEIGPLLEELGEKIARGELDPGIGRQESWRNVDAVARSLLAREFGGKAVLRID